MANKELNLHSPFSRLGTHVYGERFVGRSNLVKHIQRNIVERNISIVGLPKIGKTSLAYHSIIENSGDVVADCVFCPVFYNAGLARTADDFFINLLKSIRLNLLPILDEANINRLNSLYAIVKEGNFDSEEIRNFFESGISTFPVNIVVLFDEFDRVRTIRFTGYDFSLLRAILSVRNVRGLITSKRTIYSLENWNIDTDAGPSNFYQLFQGNTIHLGQYDQESLNEYWERLIPYYDNINIRLDTDYIANAIFYAGSHPHLLDVYNALFYDSIINFETEPSDTNVMATMTDAFNSTIEILKSEELLDAAIQAIVGPVYNITEDQINKLIEYDFIKKVTIKEKYELLESNLGYEETAKDGLEEVRFSYVASSPYFTLLMQNYFQNKVDFWKEWTSTFCLLRNLAEKFFVDNWGVDWETASDMDNVIEGMNRLYQKDIYYNIAPSPKLEYLTETFLRDLLHRNWDTFKIVFTPWSEKQFFEKYEFILMMRNHHAHISKNSLSDENLEEANRYLNEIYNKIESWLSKDGTSMLISYKKNTTKKNKGDIIKENLLQKPVMNTCGQYPSQIRRGKFLKNENKIEENGSHYRCDAFTFQDSNIPDGAEVEYVLKYEVVTLGSGRTKKRYKAYNIRVSNK